MFDILLNAVLFLLNAILIWPVLRYNAHMLQQNTYRNTEQMVWLKINYHKQSSLIINFILVAGAAVTGNPVLFILSVAFTVFLIYYFNFLKKYNSKKPLVFTARVKRLLFTDILISALPVLIVFLTVKDALKISAVLVSLLAALQECMVMLANIINRPVENAIHSRFISMAKKILKERDDLKVIGITGSYGKTSMKYYLNALLSSRYNVVMTPGNYNTPMGIVITIRNYLKRTDQIFLCEMGARHVGDIKECCDIVHPQWGIITSVGPQHLETFHTLSNVQKTKFELADSLPDDGIIYVNMDSDPAALKAGDYNNVIGYSAMGKLKGNILRGYSAGNISMSATGTKFTVTAPDGSSEEFETRLLGMHNVTNLCGAVAVSHELGIELHDLIIPVRRLKPVPHRLEISNKSAGVTIIDDAYNSNPEGSKAAVETLGMFDGVKILVTPGMVELGDKQSEYNRRFGGYAAENCDYIVLIGHTNMKDIADGAKDAGFPESRIMSFVKLTDAMKYVYQIQDQGHKYILLENDLPDNY